MANLKVYLNEGSYQIKSYELETGTDNLVENIRIAKEITADDLETQIRYRNSETGYWAEIEIPGYGRIRTKYDSTKTQYDGTGFLYWDLVIHPGIANWQAFEYLQYTKSIIG
jgi:hypothetical protein